MGDAPKDLQSLARDGVRQVLEGRGGRGAMAIVAAAKAVLSSDDLAWESMDDGQLDAHLARVIAEVERRRVKAKP